MGLPKVGISLDDCSSFGSDMSDSASLFEMGLNGQTSVLGLVPEYIGLANVDCNSNIGVHAFTCPELQWMHHVLSDNRVDLGRNAQFEHFYCGRQ